MEDNRVFAVLCVVCADLNSYYLHQKLSMSRKGKFTVWQTSLSFVLILVLSDNNQPL